MPSIRRTDGTVTFSQYDVVGADGIQPRFIRHTGLASFSGEQPHNAVAVFDMAPPLHIAVVGQMSVDTVSTAALSDDEAKIIENFIHKYEMEHEAAQQLTRNNVHEVYCIFPHATPFEEGEDQRYVRMRFNCAGFVFEAYKRAGIHLFSEDNLEL